MGAGPVKTRVSRASQHFEDTKFILRGYSGERGSSESGSRERRCPVTLEETRDEVLRIMAKHPGASLVKIADLFMQEFPRYTPRMNGNKVQRIKSNAALQSEMGRAEIGDVWWGQTSLPRGRF